MKLLAPFLLAAAVLLVSTACDRTLSQARKTVYVPWEEGLTLIYEDTTLLSPAKRFEERLQRRVASSKETPAGRRVIITGLPAIAQTLLRRLRTFMGEIFVDPTKGVPWLQQVIGRKDVQPANVAGILRRETLASPGIAACGPVSVVISSAARSCRVTLTATATTGETVAVTDEEIAP